APTHPSGPRYRAARLVRPPPPDPALPPQRWRPARSLPRLALRGHAATDDGGGRRPPIRAIPCPLPGYRGSRRRTGGGCDGGMGGPRLLRPRPQPACLRARGGGDGRLPPHGRVAARPAGHRRLYGRRRRRDRLRRAGGAGRRQCGARRRPPPGRGDAAAGRQAAPRRRGLRLHGGCGGPRPARRLRPGALRPRRHHLYAEGPGLRPLPLARRLPRPAARHPGRAPPQVAEARPPAAPRRAFPAGRRGGADAAPPPPAARPARRHAGTPRHPLARRALDRAGGPGPCARAEPRLASPAGRRAAWLHAFRAGDGALCGRRPAPRPAGGHGGARPGGSGIRPADGDAAAPGPGWL
ncbi:MAG: A/G-specific adenine glycosylase, partial [uncultured Craurococcus sp.]